MTAARPDRPPTPMEIAKQHVEHALGRKIAKRLDTYEDGTFFVSAGDWARLLAWFVDFLVYLLCAVGGFVALAVAGPAEVPGNVAALAMVGLLIGVPLLYGLFYGNGRVLGAVLTGTRLVRVRNGDRIGAAACWAMLVRTLLFPALLVVLTMAGSTEGSIRRISIDEAATRRLHAAGFLRLDAPGPAGGR